MTDLGDLIPEEAINLAEEYPMPDANDTFLKQTGARTLYTQSVSTNWGVYTDSYKEAADKLVGVLSGRPEDDSLICPIIFMYRHYLELSLKPLAKAIESWAGTAMPNAHGGHGLIELWRYIEANLGRAHLTIDQGLADNIRRLIGEMSKLDPNSTLFRYPVDRQGGEMPIPLHSLDPDNFKRVMQALSNALDTLSTQIELRDEWLAEQASW